MMKFSVLLTILGSLFYQSAQGAQCKVECSVKVRPILDKMKIRSKADSQQFSMACQQNGGIVRYGIHFCDREVDQYNYCVSPTDEIERYTGEARDESNVKARQLANRDCYRQIENDIYTCPQEQYYRAKGDSGTHSFDSVTCD